MSNSSAEDPREILRKNAENMMPPSFPKQRLRPAEQATLSPMDNCAVKGIFSGVVGK